MAQPRRRHQEHDEQRALISWIRVNEKAYPSLSRLYAIPNGGWRSASEGKALKAEGVLAGVWDLHLDLPMGEHHGLYIEMKAGKNGLSEEQVKFADARGDDFRFVVCYSWYEAAHAICDYCQFPSLRAFLPPLSSSDARSGGETPLSSRPQRLPRNGRRSPVG